MAPIDDEALACIPPPPPKPEPSMLRTSETELNEWVQDIDEVSAQIKGIIDGDITDFEAFDQKMALKERMKQIREEEQEIRRQNFFLNGTEGKGEGDRYKWWCKRCFIEYLIDLPRNACTRCKQSDKMISQKERREELMSKLADYKETKNKHQCRKDKWLRWKKSQALLKRSKYINYKAWEYWEPDTDTEDEGEPIVPRDNPAFLAMEADMKDRRRKSSEKSKTAAKCRQRGNQCMKENDYTGAIENYDEGLEYRRDDKALWTNKALAELKVFRWHDAISSCNKVIEYSEIFEDGFVKSADACFKAFTRRATALRALHQWTEAIEDLEDALKLFQKNREAKDLLELTRAALAECSVNQADQAKKDAKETNAEETQPRPVQPNGLVRIEIEEETSDEENEISNGHIAAGTSVLAGLSRKQFKEMLRRLETDDSERARFCVRSGPNANLKKEESRKLELKKIEEVQEQSKLDEVIKCAEKCAILWKKNTGNVVPLRSDVQHLGTKESQERAEEREAMTFVGTVAPRVISVLLALARNSEHHCSLTAPAVRHIWPMMTNQEWKHSIMELLVEWSQKSTSARTMAVFASRHPNPHLKLVVDAFSEDSKENMLPPGFEETARQASERLKGNSDGMSDVFEDMVSGLSKHSLAELAVSTIGNMCLAGQGLPAFKEQLLPFCDKIVTALARQIKPMNWRLCGRAAAAVCNILRLGDSYSTTIEQQCIKPLVEALRGETGEINGESVDSFMKLLRSSGGGGHNEPRSPGTDGATTRLLAALVNVITVRPSCVPRLLELGLLDISISLMNPQKAADLATHGSDADNSAEDICGRANTVVGRLLGRSPEALSIERETDLLKLLLASLNGGRAVARAVSKGGDSAIELEAVEKLELAVRMVALIISKTPGALDRLTQRAGRCEELPDDSPVGKSPLAVPAVCFGELSTRLIEIAQAAKPSLHVPAEQEGNAISRLRGNLALLLGTLCDAQALDDAPSQLRAVDFTPLVEIYVETLRRERGSAQNNIGVFVTKLASSARYKKAVRDAGGMEALHQIQLPKVEAQKAAAQRKHRMETNTDAKIAEVRRRKDLNGID